MTAQLYPLLFEPVYKDYIWGGKRIAEKLNRQTGTIICAESWEIADRPEGMSIVTNGPLAGTSLRHLCAEMGASLLGNAAGSDAFPLLIKIIDAEQKLSLQVHPDENSATACQGEPKTEMWYVLDAKPGARVFAGLKPGITSQSFKLLLEQKRLEEALFSLSIQPGDTIFVPGGRLHAIGEGCMMLEIQQNSNTTYRVYDWDRTGTDGKPRELHVEQAFKAIHWNDNSPEIIKPEKMSEETGNTIWKLLNCPYFYAERLNLTKPLLVEKDAQTFHALFTVNGRIMIEGNGTTITIDPGTSCLIPAGMKTYTLNPAEKEAVLIRILPTG